MTTTSPDSLMEAIAAARAGNRVRARELLSRLLRTDSSNAEYWLWMSSVVDSNRERIYCLESAQKLDPTNPAILRGLAILGVRKPQEGEFAAKTKLSRRQIASIAPKAAARQGPSFNWRLVLISVAALVFLGTAGVLAVNLFTPRQLAQAPTLPPVTATHTATPLEPTPTHTMIAAAVRVLRTPIPTELAGTPIEFFVPATPTTTPVVGVTPNSYEAYDSGINAIIRGDFEAALGYFDQVLELDGKLADAHYFRGESLRNLYLLSENQDNVDLFAQALSAYDRAILLNPEYAPAYLGRGRTFLARTLRLVKEEDLKPTDLPADFTKAIEVDPLFSQAYIDIAGFYSRVRLWKTMEETLQAGIDAGLTDPAMFILISKAQINRERFEVALENAIEGSASDPTNLEGYLILGWAFVRLEQYNAALAPLYTYVAYRGDDYLGWSNLGRAQLGIGDFIQAASSLDRALEINTRYAPAYLARGWLNIKLGFAETALSDLNNARRYGREGYDLFLGFGQVYYMLRDSKQALENINTAINLANQQQKRVDVERMAAEGYALRALVYEFNPELRDEAIRNWRLILQYEYANPQTRALAEEHLLELTGEIPTPFPTSTRTTTPTPTRTPTPSTSPTQGTTTPPPDGEPPS